MMKVIIEITNHEEAQAAQNMLSAYLGNTEVPAPVKEEKKVPVARAKDAVKKDTTAKTKPAPKEEPAEEKEAGSITQADLTAIAKAAVAKTDRATVKDIISAYGAKISEVSEEDYQKLAEELKAL